MKEHSTLSQHILEKKKGILASPWNHSMRGSDINFAPNSWSRERLPEYLWMGLILCKYGRKETFNKLFPILNGITKIETTIDYPRISNIIALEHQKQVSIYELMLGHICKEDIAPLTVILNGFDYPIFFEYFNDNTMAIEHRLNIIEKTIHKIWNHQSNEATDIRYLAICISIFKKNIQLPRETAVALMEYPITEHENEKMRSYRPSVRSLECIDFGERKHEFSEIFWKKLGIIDECNPFFINHEEKTEVDENIISDIRSALDFSLAKYKAESLDDDKFSVFNGTVCYALKIFEEIITKELNNSILGRHGIRSIIEMIIILKYLLKEEPNHVNIWKEYKQYGIGKYKLILLKSRENKNSKEKSHFLEPLIEILVNEIGWEEFQDVDLKYFDKLGIREKSQEVGEKDLYDVLYDYDSSYVHGLWGAIRESSMIACDNANHKFHSVPDIYNFQKQPNVLFDTEKYTIRLLKIYNESYSFPDWFIEKYFKAEI